MIGGGTPRLSDAPGRPPRGATLPELLFLLFLIGLLAAVASPLFDVGVEPGPPEEVTRELRAVLRGAERYAAEHDRWPRSVEELVQAGDYVPGGTVRICLYRAVPGTPFRAPFILVYAAAPSGRWVVFTAYPTWGGRLSDFPARTRGCSGL